MVVASSVLCLRNILQSEGSGVQVKLIDFIIFEFVWKLAHAHFLGKGRQHTAQQVLGASDSVGTNWSEWCQRDI